MLDVDTVGLKVLKHQHKLVTSRAPNVAMPAGYRAGKSRGLVLWAILRAYENAIQGHVLAGMLVEPNSKMVSRVLIRDIEDVCRELEIPITHWKMEARIRLHFGDGYEFDLYLSSADRPESLVGTTLCFVAVDEAGVTRNADEVIRRAMSRVSEPRATIRQFLATGTPEGFGPFYSFAEGKPPPGTELIRARTWDNHFLMPSPASYIEQSLGYLTEQEKLQYVEGQFIARGGRVYDFFRSEEHERRCEAPFDGEVILGCDFGVTTAVFALGTVYADVDERRGMAPKVTERVHWWGEIVGRRSSTLTMVDRAKDAIIDAHVRYTGDHVEWPVMVSRRIKAYCDAAPNARADREILLDRGFDVISASRNDTIMDRVYSVNAKTKAGELHVDPETAPYLAACLRQQGYDKWGRPEKPFDDGTGDPGPDHGADAVGYAVVHRWPVLAPLREFGVHRHH